MPTQPLIDNVADLDIVSGIRRWAHAIPAAAAVDVDGELIGYAELVARAEAVAGALSDAGVRAGDVVAVALDDPADRVAAMAGALFAGCCYLPIDGGLPRERLAAINDDAAPAVVLARSGATIDGVRTLSMDEALAHPPVSGPAPAPDSIAVVYFTSGSSGRPKGVPLPHRGVVRLFCGEPPIDLRPGTRMAHAAYPMFDATTLEVWGPLLQGGTIVALDREALLDAQALRHTLAERRIDTLFVTTALFHQIAARAPESFADLDTLYVGGEALDGRLAARVVHAGPPQRFRNLYGPTETTTLATWWPVTTADTGPATPIGRAVPATSVYVLDRQWRPVGEGEIGELFVGGDGLGPGYLRHSAMTATSFVPDPYAGTPGARMYRTGDLVELGKDGVLTFVGRRDRQVKLSGFRIELEEVEAALRWHPRVTAAVVEPGPARLEAYVTGAVTVDEVRAHAADVLPAYMVPAVIEVLDRLPIAAGGKVDRARLRIHSAATPAGHSTQDTVARVWAAVLGRADVPLDDNFFDLGGSSLLLMDVQARLAAVGAAVAVGELLAHPTVRAQAALIDGRARTADPVAPARVSNREALRRRRAAVLAEGRRDDRRD